MVIRILSLFILWLNLSTTNNTAEPLSSPAKKPEIHLTHQQSNPSQQLQKNIKTNAHDTTTKTSRSNIWSALTDEFSLNHEVHKPEVQKQIKWIKKHPEYITHAAKQSKPYLYHILKELKKRNMPGELALIPIIESEFDPFSSSSAGASGIWQLMPKTAIEFGVIKSWWVDGRKSITPSTNAALNYLTYLHRFFHGNWILAVAAYDSGERTVSRAVKRSHRKQFWSLQLPHETKAYIPKLLALSEVIQHPERYHIQLPNIPEEPYFQEVEIGGRIDLNHIAKLAKIPSHDLLLLNPGFKTWSTLPSRPYKLLIPTTHIKDFNRNLANLPKYAKNGVK